MLLSHRVFSFFIHIKSRDSSRVTHVMHSSHSAHQHVRIALRKNSDGAAFDQQGDADEVESNLYARLQPLAPILSASCRSQAFCSYDSAQRANGSSSSFATPISTHPAFTPGGRTGAGGGHDTPLPSLKKQPVATPKLEVKAADKSKSIGGNKLPQNQLLAMQCRTMCVMLAMRIRPLD